MSSHHRGRFGRENRPGRPQWSAIQEVSGVGENASYAGSSIYDDDDDDDSLASDSIKSRLPARKYIGDGSVNDDGSILSEQSGRPSRFEEESASYFSGSASDNGSKTKHSNTSYLQVRTIRDGAARTRITLSKNTLSNSEESNINSWEDFFSESGSSNGSQSYDSSQVKGEDESLDSLGF